MCVPPNVGGSDKSRLWVGIGGSEMNRLWCVANGMSDKQSYSKCSKWPPSARIHGPSLFTTDQLHRPPHSAEIQPMSQRFHNSSVSRIGTQYAWKTEKDKKIVHLQGIVRWHFSGVVVREQPSVFFWDNVNNLKYVWIILLKNDFFGFRKVKWLQYTGEVGKCTSHWCQIFSGFNIPKIMTFLGHSVYSCRFQILAGFRQGGILSPVYFFLFFLLVMQMRRLGLCHV